MKYLTDGSCQCLEKNPPKEFPHDVWQLMGITEAGIANYGSELYCSYDSGSGGYDSGSGGYDSGSGGYDSGSSSYDSGYDSCSSSYDSGYDGCGSDVMADTYAFKVRPYEDKRQFIVCYSGNCYKLTKTSTTMCEKMFYYCRGLVSLDLSKFGTSNVTCMRGMFYHCSSLKSLDLSNFDTSKVTDMSSMFYACTSLTSLDLSNFDTSNVTNMSSMFQYCPSKLNITCKAAFRDWCIKNAYTIYLPSPLRTSDSPQWNCIG